MVKNLKTEDKLKDLFLKQVEELLKEYNDKKGSKSSIPEGGNNDIIIHSLITRIFATLKRIVGINSEYYKHALKVNSRSWIDSKILDSLIGIIDALFHDLKNNYLKSLTEIIHGEVFRDYLEMAEYLLNQAFKDAAAVITGSTLEEHLRKLCVKNGIDVDIISYGRSKPKNADRLNSELTRLEIYSKLDQKNVTAWLDLRNKAAHGNYSEYQEDQVMQLIAGVKDFIKRKSA